MCALPFHFKDTWPQKRVFLIALDICLKSNYHHPQPQFAQSQIILRHGNSSVRYIISSL